MNPIKLHPRIDGAEVRRQIGVGETLLIAHLAAGGMHHVGVRRDSRPSWPQGARK